MVLYPNSLYDLNVGYTVNTERSSTRSTRDAVSDLTEVRGPGGPAVSLRLRYRLYL